MFKVYVFKITPDRYSKYPSFELIVKSSGTIFKDYTWHCLPGYLKRNSGVISPMDQPSNHNLSTFSLVAEKLCGAILCKENVPYYGYLADVPKNPSIGNKGFALVDYMRQSLPPVMAFFRPDVTLYSEWEIINVC